MRIEPFRGPILMLPGVEEHLILGERPEGGYLLMAEGKDVGVYATLEEAAVAARDRMRSMGETDEEYLRLVLDLEYWDRNHWPAKETN